MKRMDDRGAPGHIVPLTDEEYLRLRQHGRKKIGMIVLMPFIFFAMMVISRWEDVRRSGILQNEGSVDSQVLILLYKIFAIGMLIIIPITIFLIHRWKTRMLDHSKVTYHAVLDTMLLQGGTGWNYRIVWRRDDRRVVREREWFVDYGTYRDLRYKGRKGDALRITETYPSGVVLGVEKITDTVQAERDAPAWKP